MDFLNPKKKRAHRLRLMVGYVLVAIALAMTTLILVLLSYGYDLDRKTGAVIQNGIVFLDSQPVAADVYVNGLPQSSRTHSKLVLPGGQYSVELKRDGYRNWLRRFTLQGGSVERLEYPKLFPTKLLTKDIDLYGSQPAFISQSPDRHWLLIQQPGQILKFDVMDVTNNEANVTSLTLPATLLSSPKAANQSWQLVEWSADNRHVLLRHHFANSDEFIMVDRQNPATSFNVDQLLKQTPSQVRLRNKRFDQLYLYDNVHKTLQLGDAKTRRVTPVLTGVLAFEPHDDKTILFVSDSGPTGQVTLKLSSNGNIFTLRQLPAKDSYLLAVGHFDGRWYMIASAKSQNRTYIYRDPEAALKRQSVSSGLLPAIVLIIDKPQFLSLSHTGRFVAVQSGSHFAVYDAENDRRYYYDSGTAVTADGQASWMDDFRLSLVSRSKAVVFDFDGTNQQQLVPSYPSQPLVFDPGYKWLYTLAPSLTVRSRTAVTRTDLIVK